jgi:hypothetical protein
MLGQLCSQHKHVRVWVHMEMVPYREGAHDKLVHPLEFKLGRTRMESHRRCFTLWMVSSTNQTGGNTHTRCPSSVQSRVSASKPRPFGAGVAVKKREALWNRSCMPAKASPVGWPHRSAMVWVKEGERPKSEASSTLDRWSACWISADSRGFHMH